MAQKLSIGQSAFLWTMGGLWHSLTKLVKTRNDTYWEKSQCQVLAPTTRWQNVMTCC